MYFFLCAAPSTREQKKTFLGKHNYNIFVEKYNKNYIFIYKIKFNYYSSSAREFQQDLITRSPSSLSKYRPAPKGIW